MAEPTNYATHYQQQQAYDPSATAYNPSSVTHQYYDHSAYAYSYHNPQYTNIQPYPYPNYSVQQSHHEVQEPNPPGVATPASAPQQAQNYYYQYPTYDPAAVAASAVHTVGSQHGAVDPAAVGVHQPVAQSSYGAIGLVHAVLAQGGGQTPVGPRPKAPTRPIRGRGRGRGRGLHKRAAAPSQDQAIFSQGGPNIQGGPPQSVPEPYASTFAPMPYQGRGHAMPVLPPPQAARCELCGVDCNSLDILEQHKNGKKHQKKLKAFEGTQILNRRAIGQQTILASTSEPAPETPFQPHQIEGSVNQQVLPETLPPQAINRESKVAVENPKVEEIEPTKESEKKATVDHSEGPARGFTRKMRGGKVGRRMKPYGRAQRLVEPPKPKEVIPLVCELCNVTCESTVVFQSHLVGKKHLSKAKRFLSQQEALGHAVLQALQQFTAHASTSIAPHLQHQGFVLNQIAPAQNANPIDVQASTSQPNFDSVKVDVITQPQPVPTNLEAGILVNAEGKPKEEVPAATQPVASGTTSAEAS